MTKDRTGSVAAADFDGASTMDLSGRCVGSSYILQHPIGQGATGTVWRGLDRASGEPVAVKLLHESLLRQPKLVTRFVQERTILLMLRHRNVVRVRDLFSVGETLGLVMDLVDGGSLRDHLREHGTVPLGEAARLAAQVAAALAEAHDLGVVHRDLKPDNILLQTENGRLDTRLTDFGVARILNTPSLTTPSAVVGTPHYMAPEAFHGSTASPATDVYALGVLVYELITGRPPYESDSIPDLMRRHMDGNPARRPGIPDDLWDLIMSCMELKPRLRPSAAEMVAGLSDAARRFADRPALPRPEHPVVPSEIDASLDLALPGRSGRGRADVPFWVDEVSQWDVPSGQRHAVDAAGGGPTADGPKAAGGRARTGPGEAEVAARHPAVDRWAAVPSARDGSDRGAGVGGGRTDDRVGEGKLSPVNVVPSAAGEGKLRPVNVVPSAGGAGIGEGRVSPVSVVPSAGGAGVGDGGAASDGAGGGGVAGLGSAGGRSLREGRPPEPMPAVARQRGGPARKRWWAKPGVTVTVIAAATIATMAGNLGRARNEPSAGARPRVLAAPTGTRPPSRAAAGATNPDRAKPARVAATSPSARQAGTGTVRRGTASRVPLGRPAPAGTASRSPQPEGKPYGPWQCTPGFAFDMASRTPLAAKPCHMLGRDIQYRASLTAPGGATGSISITLRDVASGRTVAGPTTCDGLVFGGDAATESCGPAAVGPARGHRYAVVMSYRYERDGRTVAGTSKGSAFTW